MPPFRPELSNYPPPVRPPSPSSAPTQLSETDGELKPIDRRALVTIGLVGASTVVAALIMVNAITLFPRLSSMETLRESVDRVDTQLQIQSILIVVFLLAFVSAGVATMVLFKQMMDNGEKMNPGQATLKSGWAIGAWIVPILNLYRPMKVAEQIWSTSYSKESPSAGHPRIIRVWWAAYLLMTILTQIWPDTPSVEVTLESIQNESLFVLIWGGLVVDTGALFLVVLRQLTNRHRKALAANIRTPAFR